MAAIPFFPPCDNKFIVKDCVSAREAKDIGGNVFQQTQHDNELGLSVEDRDCIELMDR